MRLVGWVFSCLFISSAICERAFPKNAYSEERKNVSAITSTSESQKEICDSAFLLSTNQLSRNLLEHPKKLSLLPHSNAGKKGSRKVLNSTDGEARTFGHKRIQFMLMPLMYKMGVMMTLLTILTVISLKGLLVGAILLILKLSTILGKFTSGWSSSSYAHPPPAAPLPFHGWSSPSNQPIHLHLHNNIPYHPHDWLAPTAPDHLDLADQPHPQHYYFKG